ncbi:MAG: ribonuclease III [Chloroflexota bacterium]|nr:ribonuclease III [Chloroflexota bacterium]
MRSADGFAARLGLPIRDLDLLDQALTHSSFLHEHRDSVSGHNERLEFLGDAVVTLVIGEALFRLRPNDDEGVLSARRAAIVSAQGLARIARRIELGEALRLGEGESRRDGRTRVSLLASGFEALVGAIYLDLGYDVVRDWVLEQAQPELLSDAPLSSLKSAKSRLQEHTQRTNGERPHYRLVDASGPDHDKLFRVEVSVGGRVLGTGEGRSQKSAEIAAAEAALPGLRETASA